MPPNATVRLQKARGLFAAPGALTKLAEWLDP